MKNATDPELASALATAITLRIAKCWQIVKRRAEAVIHEIAHISLREVWVLLAASGAAPVTQKQIANHLDLNENVIVLLLDRLEKSGHGRGTPRTGVNTLCASRPKAAPWFAPC